MKRIVVSSLVCFACAASAQERLPGAAAREPQIGDCVMLREGGVGRVLKTPTYWLRGTVAGVSHARHYAGLCPHPGKPESAYTRDDWLRLAAVAPCVDDPAAAREVPVLRLAVRVEAWETPWSNQHGSVRFLFRGEFLDRPLKKGEVIEIDASWLQGCESG